MSYDENEDLEDGFKMGGADDDELDEPLDMPDMPLDDDDPEDKFH